MAVDPSPLLFQLYIKLKSLHSINTVSSAVKLNDNNMKSTVASVVLAWVEIVIVIIQSTVGYTREVMLDQWEPWSPKCRNGDNDIAPVQCPQISVRLPILEQDVQMNLCDWDAIKTNALSGKLATHCAQLYTYIGPEKLYIGCAPWKRPRGRLLQTVKPPELVD